MTSLSGNEQSGRSLVESHTRLAIGVAHKLMASLGLPSSFREEAESLALLGLTEAAQRYDPSRGVSFSTFAYYRIRGAIYDGLRKVGLPSRNVEALLNKEENADAILESRGAGGSKPQDLESAVADLADTLAEVAFLEAHMTGPVSVNVERLADDSASVEERAAAREEQQALSEALDVLDERERRLVEMVYFGGLTLAEAGRKLGLSRSWACRLHRKATDKLRQALLDRGLSP